MLFHFFRKLRDDISGVGFVELALTAPLLALMFLGMTDLSIIVASRIDLEQAAQRTTDLALAKRPTSTDTSYLVAEAMAASGRPASDVTVTYILECNGTVMSSFNDTCAAGEVPKRFVSVSIVEPVTTGFNWRGLAGMFTGEVAAYEGTTVTGDSIVRLQ